MKAFKSAQAGVMETMHNVVAKADEKSELNKAASAAKKERKAADGNRASKHDAEAKYHTRQAEIVREYEMKKSNNAAEKEQTRAALSQKKADKHTNKKGATLGEDNENETTRAPPAGESDGQAEAGATQEAPAAVGSEDGPAQTGQTEETLDGGDKSSDPVASSGAGEEDLTDSNPTADGESAPVSNNEVPMHGSGVPTHSTLHSDGDDDTHDVHTTQTMEASPNTGSYM